MKTGKSNRIFQFTEGCFNPPPHKIESFYLLGREPERIQIRNNAFIGIIGKPEANDAQGNVVKFILLQIIERRVLL